MPRSSGGTYTLYTPGNPVVTATVISSTWANNTLNDIATAMTDSLSRTGQGGMSAPLQLANGTVANPGLTWGAETTAGMYRAGVGDFRFAIGGTDILKFTSAGSTFTGQGLFANGSAAAPSISFASETTSGMYRAAANDYRWVLGSAVELLQLTTNLVQLSGTAPTFRINESDAAANNRLWDVQVDAGQMVFRSLTDALAASNFITLTRSGGTVTSIALGAPLSATQMQFQGATITSGNASFQNSFVANTSVGIDVVSTRPHIRWSESDASTNNGRWLMGPQTEQFIAAIASDNEGTITNWLQVDRTTTTVDTINFPNGVLQYGGNEVGYRNIVGGGTFSSSTSAGNADRGGIFRYTGTGGHTLTFPNTVTAGGIMSVVNEGSGNLTLAGSSVTINWFNGSGTVSTGSRTLAVSGVATIWYVTTGAAYVWGTGIS